ncbi:MAG: NAD-dependent protein deacylase [Candidatus Latescibacteria bacterium]|nr:NAD-dependent protein deacylase [bacterium]MBD3424740.1 NAD-dependent protein deacylase [Candidatus Latescibacterota bacterium]
MLSGSNVTTVSTGAGISKESGIPTFRGSDGIWKSKNPKELASLEGFLSNPELVWKWYMQRLFTAREKDPNPAHLALVDLEGMIPHLTVITQNVDNLHRRAGSRKVVELHGNIEHFRCLECAHTADFDPEWDDRPPRCPECGSYIRPDIVWFGEQLPRTELEYAFDISSRSDTFLIIGTSGTVQPAAQLPIMARRNGARLIEINVTESAFTGQVDISLQGKAGEILPLIVNEIRAENSS